jgi:hypothetical protein
VFFIARADNESGCVMFRDIGGSTAFVFLNARGTVFESKLPE